jgi:hypothetical protein
LRVGACTRAIEQRYVGRADAWVQLVLNPFRLGSIRNAPMTPVSAAYPAGEKFSPPNMNATSQLLSAPSLASALAAGAVGVILVWTNVSDLRARSGSSTR